MSSNNPFSATIDWALDELVDQVGAQHAAVFSKDGLRIEKSSGLDNASADRLSTAASGLVSLSWHLTADYDGGTLEQSLVQSENLTIIIMAAGDGASLVLLMSPECDLGNASFQMAQLVQRVRSRLSTQPRSAGAEV